MAPLPTDDRDVLQRWLAAIGLTAAAEDAARVDTPETNALSLLGAYAAIEVLLGLFGGTRPYKRDEEVTFPALLNAAEASVKLDRPLRDDLRRVNRMRNDFVHASNTVHTNEAARATSAARRLLEEVPQHLAAAAILKPGAGIASAVATVINVEAVGIWLREADEALAAGRVDQAADDCARAFNAALNRTVPELHTDRRLSRAASDKVLRAMSRGMGMDRHDSNVAERIEGLQAWVVPLALGVSPSAYGRLRSVLGEVIHYDSGGAPAVVDRRGKAVDEGQVRKALATVSEVVFRLWAMGSLRPDEYDDQLVERARAWLSKRSPAGG